MTTASRFGERLTINGAKVYIELYGSLNCAMISEKHKKVMNVLFLGYIEPFRCRRNLNPKEVTKRTKIRHQMLRCVFIKAI